MWKSSCSQDPTQDTKILFNFNIWVGYGLSLDHTGQTKLYKPQHGVFEVPDGNPPLQPLPLPMCGRAQVVPGQTPGPLVHGVLAPRQDYGAGSHSLPPTTKRGGGDSQRVDGTLAHSSKGNKTISGLGKSPVAGSTSSLPPTTEHGGEPRRVDGTLAR